MHEGQRHAVGRKGDAGGVGQVVEQVVQGALCRQERGSTVLGKEQQLFLDHGSTGARELQRLPGFRAGGRAGVRT